MYYTFPSLIEGIDTGFVRRVDGALVSTQSEEYLAWVAEGNTPEEWVDDASN